MRENGKMDKIRIQYEKKLGDFLKNIKKIFIFLFCIFGFFSI